MNDRYLRAVALVLLVLSSRLSAQDVTLSDPAWFDPSHPPAEQAPTFKRKPHLDCPAGLESLATVECATIARWVDETGKGTRYRTVGSNPLLGEALDGVHEEFRPALSAGKPVRALCWYAATFNPRTAATSGPNATPRVSQVRLVVAPREKIPDGQEIPWVIKARVNLDEQGRPASVVFNDKLHEVLRPEVELALQGWGFAPARREGRPVPAELIVPLTIVNPPRAAAEKRTLPRAVSKPDVRYPASMAGGRQRGHVEVEVTVGIDGSVGNAAVVRTTNQGFNEAALAAARKMKFEPATHDGKPVEASIIEVFRFGVEGMNDEGKSMWTIESKDSGDGDRSFDTLPKVKNAVLPVYPYALLRDRISGKAQVKVAIGADGRVFGAVLASASHSEFGSALLASAQQLVFLPATKAGVPVVSFLVVEQVFDWSEARGLVRLAEWKLLDLEKDHSSEIVSAKKLDAPLEVVSQKRPVFPLGLSATKGQAMVEILVGKDGVVRLPRILQSSEPAFGYAAVQAVSEWRFAPPKAAGKPVVVRVRVPIDFELAEADARQAR